MKLSKLQKNDILANPVERFSKSCPRASQQHLTTLASLEQKFEAIKEQLKQAQSQSKKISRQIGEAKRNKLPTEELLQTMQQQSSVTKSLNKTLNSISSEILGYFEHNENNQSTTIKPALPPARIHTKQTNENENEKIIISQLHDEYDAWNQYVHSNPATSLYHRAEWKQLIEKVFGHECYFFYASVKGEVVGVLPLVRLNSKLFGDFMASMPYFNSGGAIANNQSIELNLITTANDFAKKIGVSHIEYRDDVPREQLPARTEKVNMILSLTNSEDNLWGNFPSKLRSQIRRAQREKALISIGGKEYLSDFYSVFAQNMRDLGTPVYSKSFFENILSTFPNNSKVIIIRLQNRPVAAALLLGNKNTLEIPWASTIKRVNHLSINMLLYWEVLRFAIKNQYHYFDFGRSSKDAGTYRFKQQWGALPKQLYWHYWLSDNVEMPQLNPNNPKFALVINIWKKTPVFITKIIGPYIVKNLP